jgi:cell wall-associated NlpC family hydrolase
MAGMITACPGSRPNAGRSAPSTSLTAPVQTSLPAIAYTIQVGAFSSAERAARLSDRLEQVGIDAYYFIDSDRLYKVRFERFDAKAAARQRAIDLQTRGVIDAFYIVSPRAGAQRSGNGSRLPADLARTAQSFIGTRYRWGGSSAKTGFDCSGLTMTVYRLNGLHLPRSARSQYAAGRPVSAGALRQGDLVFFTTTYRSRVSHVGIYIGNNRFVHAPGRGKSIRTTALSNRYFKKRYIGARRYF